MTHTLPDLPFSPDALAPWLTAETFSYHHGKHHATYVNNLNKLIAGTEFAEAPLENIVRRADGGVFNNAAQHFNHSFYWNCLRAAGGDGPSAELSKAIDKAFGSMDEFQNQFGTTAKTLFGSGWAWLVKNQSGDLELLGLSNAGCPLTEGKTPILTCDVWEHAYYIDHRNARPAYVDGFWKHVDWGFASSQYQGA